MLVEPRLVYLNPHGMYHRCMSVPEPPWHVPYMHVWTIVDRHLFAWPIVDRRDAYDRRD